MKIDFQITTAYGIFSDALLLPDDHSFSDQEIEAMKRERSHNWVAFVESQSNVAAEPQTGGE
jgi:hypothetical protein